MASFNSIHLSNSNNIDVNNGCFIGTTSNNSENNPFIKDSLKTCYISNSSMSFRDNTSNTATTSANAITLSHMINEYCYYKYLRKF